MRKCERINRFGKNSTHLLDIGLASDHCIKNSLVFNDKTPSHWGSTLIPQTGLCAADL